MGVKSSNGTQGNSEHLLRSFFQPFRSRGRSHTQGWPPCSYKVGLLVHPRYYVIFLFTQGWPNFLCVGPRLASFMKKDFLQWLINNDGMRGQKQTNQNNRVHMPSICICRWFKWKLQKLIYRPLTRESR